MTNAGAMVRACRGPIVLIALGALTAADTFGSYSLTRTWPVILIIFGLLKLAEKAADSRDDGPYPQGPAYAGPQGFPPQGGYTPPMPSAAAKPQPAVSSDEPKASDGQ